MDAEIDGFKIEVHDESESASDSNYEDSSTSDLIIQNKYVEKYVSIISI